MDDTDELAVHASPRPPTDGLRNVERDRRFRGDRRSGDDRSIAATEPDHGVTVTAAPLWPFRLAAIAGGVFQAFDEYSWTNWKLILATIVVSTYAVAAILRPVAYRNDTRVRLRIVVEQALHTFVVLLTGAWVSPFALCLIPTGMLAGFAAGSIFAAQIAAGSVAVVTIQHLQGIGIEVGVRDSVLWAGLLGLVAFTSGLAHQASADAARQQQLALVRVSRLAEANSLLFSLQRVAQTLPASLDLNEVVDTTIARVRSLVPSDSISLYLLNEPLGQLDAIRHHGPAAPTTIAIDDVPPAVRTAMESQRTVRLPTVSPGNGLIEHAQSGVYAVLRARGTMVGLVAVESEQPDAFTQQHAEILHGLTEPFGISIDNARLFRQIRSISADEERTRIARDLHDRVGSSLAFLGYEVDRAQQVAQLGDDVQPILGELRLHLTAVLADIRETLYDLRTDVTDDKDLPAILRELLDRVEHRRGLATDLHVFALERLPRPQERELWKIALEAITNVERHASATRLAVMFDISGGHAVMRIVDNGIGLGKNRAGADSYGMLGMRERAESIGATLRFDSPQNGGTMVSIDLTLGTPSS